MAGTPCHLQPLRAQSRHSLIHAGLLPATLFACVCEYAQCRGCDRMQRVRPQHPHRRRVWHAAEHLHHMHSRAPSCQNPAFATQYTTAQFGTRRGSTHCTPGANKHARPLLAQPPRDAQADAGGCGRHQGNLIWGSAVRDVQRAASGGAARAARELARVNAPRTLPRSRRHSGVSAMAAGSCWRACLRARVRRGQLGARRGERSARVRCRRRWRAAVLPERCGSAGAIGRSGLALI